jgi:hypothetical protein
MASPPEMGNSTELQPIAVHRCACEGATQLSRNMPGKENILKTDGE